MLKQMKAKSDEKSMKGKEDERKRATENTNIFFLRIEQESDQSGRFTKKRGKSRMTKRRKMKKQKKGRHLEKHQ